jgi:hypothetical protein
VSLEPRLATLISALPDLSAKTTPLGVTIATVVSELLQTGPGTAWSPQLAGMIALKRSD